MSEKLDVSSWKSAELFTARKDSKNQTYFQFNENVKIFYAGREIDMKNVFQNKEGEDVTVYKLYGNSETKLQEWENSQVNEGKLKPEVAASRKNFREKARVVNTVRGYFKKD